MMITGNIGFRRCRPFAGLMEFISSFLTIALTIMVDNDGLGPLDHEHRWSAKVQYTYRACNKFLLYIAIIFTQFFTFFFLVQERRYNSNKSNEKLTIRKKEKRQT